MLPAKEHKPAEDHTEDYVHKTLFSYCLTLIKHYVLWTL